MKSYAKPISDQLNATMPLLSSPKHEAYFFSCLENPLWITPFENHNVFKYPPKTENVKGGGIRYPPWPASQYLARMAEQAPVEVAAIFAKIETDNPSIIGDLLDAALAMPAGQVVSLVPAVCRAAKEGLLWIAFKDASDLCVKLAKDGQVGFAMQLADALFTPTFEDGKEGPLGRDEHWYKDGLDKVVPVLVPLESDKFLKQLCYWLKAFVKAKKQVDPKTGTDYSYMWRPAIEEHGQNDDFDLASNMVGFVRQGFELAIGDDKIGFTLAEALEISESFSYLVFKRIRLHLINEFADRDKELACSVILDQKLFDDHEYKHEYAMLVGKRLDLLSSQQKGEWFGWIDDGPDMSNFDQSIRDNLGREATEEKRQGRINCWKLEKLHWARNHLDDKRKKYYEEMLAKYGEPDMADMNIRWGQVSWGDDSPMTVEKLTEMPFKEAVEKVTSWQPEKSGFTGPNVEGLVSTFEQYVATDPVLFSTKAGVLIDKPAPFVRRFLGQMSNAAKADQSIDVLAVIKLCQWVMGRPVGEQTIPDQEVGHGLDKDWQWTRDEISQFAQNVCMAQVDDKPRYPLNGIRESLWELIIQLCQDPAQSYLVREKSEDDPRVHDYNNLGINSPRGKAVQTALEYGRWVANHIKKTEGEKEIVPKGFDAMPEVRNMLEWQIATGNRTVEALSIIGTRIGLIYWIDKKWLTDNTEKLFQLDGVEQTPPVTQGWAAWNAFLVWVGPHEEFYQLFKAQFAFAVEQAAKVQLSEHIRYQPMHRLGEHLMILYGRGHLDLDDDGLLQKFIQSANPDIRRHAIGFVGNSLQGTQDVPSEILERFKVLWKHYWAGPGKKDAEDEPDVKDKPVARLFGPWFASGSFPPEWSMEQLLQFTEVTQTLEPNRAIAKKLAEIVDVDVLKAVQILDLVVRRDQDYWRISDWLGSAKIILEQAMSSDGDAQKIAVSLINYLGRHGHADFGELLNN